MSVSIFSAQVTARYARSAYMNFHPPSIRISDRSMWSGNFKHHAKDIRLNSLRTLPGGVFSFPGARCHCVFMRHSALCRESPRMAYTGRRDTIFTWSAIFLHTRWQIAPCGTMGLDYCPPAMHLLITRRIATSFQGWTVKRVTSCLRTCRT